MESAACLITEAGNSSHFHISLIFCSLLSQPCSITEFFLFLYLFLSQKIKNMRSAYSHYATRTVRFWSAWLVIVLGWVTKYEYPRVVITFFFLFLSPSFSKATLRTAELPSLCNVVSSIYILFVPHFAMVVFMCIYLHYRINKQRDTSF